MVNQCSTCGYPGSGGLAASWTCEKCKTKNYNEQFVEAYLANVDVARMSSFMRLGRTSYQAGDFEDAIKKFDLALAEHAENSEGWAYKGLALAHLINLSNLGAIPRQVDLCFANAGETTGGDPEFLGAAHAVARERIVREMLRSALRECEQAEKSAFAFSHDKAEARQRASARYENAFRALGFCMSLPSENVGQMIEVCRLIRGASFQEFAPDASTLNMQVTAYVEAAAAAHPGVDTSLPEPPVKRAACFPAGAQVATRGGGAIRVEDLAVGDRVLGQDAQRGQWEQVQITAVRRHERIRIWEVQLEHGVTLSTTASHSLATTRGWVAVADLVPGDRCQVNGGDDATEWRGVESVRCTRRVEAVFSYVTHRHHVTRVNGVTAHEFSRFRRLRGALHAVVVLGRRLGAGADTCTLGVRPQLRESSLSYGRGASLCRVGDG